MTGTWVSVELIKAVELGYQILELYQVWHFPETRVGLFRQYVQTFLRLKQEASGYPSDCKTEAEKGQYRMQFLKKEGVRLDPDNIKHNPGLRQVAKAALNNLWGKFAERPNLPQKKYVDNPAELFSLLHDSTVNVHDMRFVNDDMVEVYTTKENAFLLPKDRCNIVIAAFTTAHARLHLYAELEKLGKRVFMFDTDSLIWESDPSDASEYQPDIGQFLGELTDELPPGDFIEEFVSAGPKNYSYLLSKSKKTVTKVKGFSLNWKNSNQINFDSICGIVKNLDHEATLLISDDCQITRDLQKMKIVNKDLSKKYRMVYDKRIIIEDYHTIPYGYVES